MSNLYIYALIGFLMLLNLWRKSLILGLAIICLLIYSFFNLPAVVSGQEYWYHIAVVIIIVAEIFFIATKTETV